MSAGFLEGGAREAPPRENGELVFAAPWESRAFGVAAALVERGVFDWNEFRAALIAEISAWEARPPAGEAWSYYARWQAALERLLAARGLCAPAELEARAGALAALPPGHDHDHDHDHDHEH
jgi:nitrile hydratase accessory protein